MKLKKPYDYKIYVCGFFQAGKTTLIHTLDSNAFSIDKPLRELYRGEKATTTVGFDLGHLVWVRPNETSDGVIMSATEFQRDFQEYEGWISKNVEIKGSPGQLHFKIVREMVAKDSDGVLLLIDSSDPSSIGNALTLLAETRCFLGFEIPLVIIANKQDLDMALSPHEITNLISERTYPGSARNNFGVKEAVIRLLRIITGEIKENICSPIMEEVIY